MAPSAAVSSSFTLLLLSPLPISMGSEVDFLHLDMFSTDGGVPVSKPVTMTAS